MHDIKFIRENPEAFDAALSRRGAEAQAKAIQKLDEKWRELTSELQTALARRNDSSKAIGAAKAKKDETEADRLMAEVAELKNQIPDLELRERDAQTQVADMLAAIPNLPDCSVPQGKDEHENAVVHIRGSIRNFAFTPREHFDIGADLGLDFETAQKVSGARFAYLRGGVARLARALGQFMLDLHTVQFGYEEVAPPILVRDAALYGTGQLPKFAEDQFRTTDDRWLIPTAEVSLTNIVNGDILADTILPCVSPLLRLVFAAKPVLRARIRAA